MFSIESAKRIVDIQTDLSTKPLSPRAREILTIEQRELWDAEHPGRSFEAISYDAWAVRRYP